MRIHFFPLVLFAVLVVSSSAFPTVFASTISSGTNASGPHSQWVIFALQKPIQLNDTKDALVGIANLQGYSNLVLFVSVPTVGSPGNMACRGDLGSAATNTWTFGAIDCHFNVPGYITMTVGSIHYPNLRLAVSGGGPTQPTWARGNATISVALYLY